MTKECTLQGELVTCVGQNRVNTPYMTVYLVIFLQKGPCIHRIYMALANPTQAKRSTWKVRLSLLSTHSSGTIDTYLRHCPRQRNLASYHHLYRHIPKALPSSAQPDVLPSLLPTHTQSPALVSGTYRSYHHFYQCIPQALPSSVQPMHTPAPLPSSAHT